MYVNAKKMAFLGLLLACAVLLVIISGILEFNTLFLLALASFGVGIAIRECGMKLGFGFFIASILLSLMIASNKLYCLTFAAMEFYIFIFEISWKKIAAGEANKSKLALYWFVKYLVFNLMYIPMVVIFPKLIYPGKISMPILGGLILGGQIVLFLYDYAYRYFQTWIWGKLRGHLHL